MLKDAQKVTSAGAAPKQTGLGLGLYGRWGRVRLEQQALLGSGSPRVPGH